MYVAKDLLRASRNLDAVHDRLHRASLDDWCSAVLRLSRPGDKCLAGTLEPLFG
jgi:hypothetical protein